MTDRNVGGLGARVDIKATPEQWVGSAALTLDYIYPLGVQTGQLGLQLDMLSTTSKRLGTIGMMVDYVFSPIPTGAVRWSGSVFETGTSSPLVYWSGGAFQSSGTAIVVWKTDHFEVAP